MLKVQLIVNGHYGIGSVWFFSVEDALHALLRDAPNRAWTDAMIVG